MSTTLFVEEVAAKVWMHPPRLLTNSVMPQRSCPAGPKKHLEKDVFILTILLNSVL